MPKIRNFYQIRDLLKNPRPLTTDDIDIMLKSTYVDYLGTFPKDQLPKTISTGQACIINLDNHDGAGTHWVAVFCGYDYCEYFDSYGIIPPPIIRKFMRSSRLEMIYSTNEIQPLNNNSILCGYYCVLYIIMRQQGIDPYDIVYTFEMDGKSSNDKLVLNKLKKFYGVKI